MTSSDGGATYRYLYILFTHVVTDVEEIWSNSGFIQMGKECLENLALIVHIEGGKQHVTSFPSFSEWTTEEEKRRTVNV